MAGGQLKSLAKDTAIYGLSSILGRFINYLLFPLYTYVFAAESGQYGVVTHIYAFTALLMVLLTFGMETGFFRYANKKEEDANTVYSSILIFVGSIASLFILVCFLFLNPISSLLGYADHQEYIGIMAVVVAFDAFQTIPFAYLRYKQRPIKFAGIKLFNILLNILLNLFFFVACPWIYERMPELISWFYDPGYGVGYVFIANLICTVSLFIFLIPELTGFRYTFDKALMKRIIRYSFPLLVLGIVGIINHSIDKIIFPFLFEDRKEADIQLGIYSAGTKIAVIMAMLTQAFRYAYEPFVFGKNKESDSKVIYASAMKYFIIFALLAFLGVMFYLDVLQYIMDIGYRPGLKVVPIVMAGEIFMGIYFNLSFWYKLTDETRWGAYFSLIGCVIIVSLNVIFVPVYGYMASAFAGMIGYFTIMVLSYAVGQKKYPIQYDLKSIGLYFLLAGVLFTLSMLIVPENMVLRMLFRTLLLLIFAGYIVKKDLPLNQIPFINRFIRK